MARSSSASILDRIGTSTDIDVAEIDQYNPGDAYRAVGFCRKAWGGEPMLDFILCDGNSEAVPYSDIRRIQFNPSTGIVIKTNDVEITILGSGLRECHRKLLQFRVVFMAEADQATRRLHATNEPLITGITFTPIQVAF